PLDLESPMAGKDEKEKARGRARGARKRASGSRGPDRPTNEDARRSPFPIVGVGASAGGFDAFKRFLGAFPADTGMGFVLVQHLDPHHESSLAAVLSRHTRMEVSQITHRMLI